ELAGTESEKEIRMKHLLVAATVTAGVWLATPAWAGPFFFRGGPRNGLRGALSQPASTGNRENETARFERVTFPEVTRLVNNGGVFNKQGLVPQGRITS